MNHKRWPGKTEKTLISCERKQNRNIKFLGSILRALQWSATKVKLFKKKVKAVKAAVNINRGKSRLYWPMITQSKHR